MSGAELDVESRTRLNALLSEFDLEVESRCNEMELSMERLKQSMRDQFRIQLMKLPRAIRSMPVAEFCEVYNADINAVVNAEEVRARSKVRAKKRVRGAAEGRGKKKEAGKSERLMGELAGMELADLQALQAKIEELSALAAK